MRKFNTSGPNISAKHYTIQRTELINKGIEFQWPIPKLLRDRHLGFWQIYIESDSENFQLFFEVKNPATFFSGE